MLQRGSIGRRSHSQARRRALRRYVQQEIHLRDAQGNSRKNLVSDFKLFAHRSNEPDVRLDLGERDCRQVVCL